MFRQICDHTFFPSGLSARSTVVDLGANHGAFSQEVIRQFGCEVIAIEANPDLCEQIAKHPRLRTLNVAMAGRSGKLSFYLSGQSDEASSILQTNHGEVTREVEVEAITLPGLMDSLGVHQIDLLKVDIEGAEIEMFEATPDDVLLRCAQITVEFHDFCGFISREAAKRVVERMRGLGFEVVKMWMRSHGDTLFVNRRLYGVSSSELAWSRYAVRNWWWVRRKIKTKLGLQRP